MAFLLSVVITKSEFGLSDWSRGAVMIADEAGGHDGNWHSGSATWATLLQAPRGARKNKIHLASPIPTLLLHLANLLSTTMDRLK